MENDEMVNPAATVMNANLSTKAMIDSDLFIFSEEIEKITNDSIIPNSVPTYRLRNYLYETIIHELGNLQGLDHQFDPSVTSIMSYDCDITRSRLYSYDIEAINLLYTDVPN